MSKSYALPRLLSVFIAIASIVFLASCATNSHQDPINNPTTPSQTSQPTSKVPPPPYVPYESYTGEAV